MRPLTDAIHQRSPQRAPHKGGSVVVQSATTAQQSSLSECHTTSPPSLNDGRSHATAKVKPQSPPSQKSRSNHSHSAGVQNSRNTSSAASSTTGGTVKRGSFSLQSGSYQYAFEPMHGSGGYSNNNILNVGASGTFPSRRGVKMDSIPVMVKAGANGHHCGSGAVTNGDMNGYGRNHGYPNGVATTSGLSTPSTTDSFHSSPMMSPKYVFPNGGHPHQLDDISICSSESDSFASVEKFYINENVDLTPTSSTHSLHGGGGGSSENEEHPFFSGMKDVRNPDSLQELKIVSARGTVRGVRNRVRAGIKAITDPKDGKSAKVCNHMTSCII